jgi:hypothetical protein
VRLQGRRLLKPKDVGEEMEQVRVNGSVEKENGPYQCQIDARHVKSVWNNINISAATILDTMKTFGKTYMS